MESVAPALRGSTLRPARTAYLVQRLTTRLSSVVAGYETPTMAAALAGGVAYLLLFFPLPAGWMDSWKELLDLYLSLWIVLFCLAVPALWGLRALVRFVTPEK